LKKEIVSAIDAPQAIGPYSQAVKAGDFIFLSGQIPLDPQTGAVLGESIQAQTRRVMENVRAVLLEAGAAFSDVVQATVYLKNMSDFDEFNAVYGEYFSMEPPARACVEVSSLPKNVMVEVAATAMLTRVKEF